MHIETGREIVQGARQFVNSKKHIELSLHAVSSGQQRRSTHIVQGSVPPVVPSHEVAASEVDPLSMAVPLSRPPSRRPPSPFPPPPPSRPASTVASSP